MKKLILIFISLSFFSVLNATQYYNPSFKCDKVKKDSLEYLICTNKELSQLDRNISELYTQIIKIDSYNLKENQSKWLEKVRNNCKTAACLKDVYLSREYFLGNLLVKTNKVFYKDKPFWKKKYTSTFIDEFNADKRVAEYELEVLHCDSVWATIADKINNGYAGMCTAMKRGYIIKVHVCYNAAFNFKIKDSNSKNEFELIQFLEKNCWGDGIE